MIRYRVARTEDDRFVIWDGVLNGRCALPTGPQDAPGAPFPIPLEWDTEDEANAFLLRCWKFWGLNPHLAPEKWSPGLVGGDVRTLTGLPHPPFFGRRETDPAGRPRLVPEVYAKRPAHTDPERPWYGDL